MEHVKINIDNRYCSFFELHIFRQNEGKKIRRKENGINKSGENLLDMSGFSVSIQLHSLKEIKYSSQSQRYV